MPNTVKRIPAQNGNTDFTTTIIHDSKKQRITLVTHYIKHNTTPDELAIKIETFDRTASGLILNEKKCVNLNPDATIKLQQELETCLAVCNKGTEGSFMVLKTDSTANRTEEDVSKIVAAFDSIITQPDIVEHLKTVEFSQELLQALKTSIRLSEMKTAISELKEYLENSENTEQVYQQWCERHTWIFGNAFLLKDEIRSISAGDKIDIMLPKVIGGYRDIIELKRSNMTVINKDDSHNSFYFSAEVSKAIGQVHRYLDVFLEEASKGLRDHPEIIAYHPRATIIIGRSNEWDSIKQKALHGLNSRLLNITVMTYDHLLAQGERLLDLLEHPENLAS